jgi:hypothetical protein
MIDEIIEYTIEHNKNYDFYFRIRPDVFVYNNQYNFKQMDVDKLYCSIKCDAPAHDAMFIMSNKLLHKWWITKIRPFANQCIHHRINTCPEYIIFNNVNIKPIYKICLIVNNKHIKDWNGSYKIIFDDTSINWKNQEYIIIDNYDKFKSIIHKYNGINDESC